MRHIIRHRHRNGRRQIIIANLEHPPKMAIAHMKEEHSALRSGVCKNMCVWSIKSYCAVLYRVVLKFTVVCVVLCGVCVAALYCVGVPVLV